MRRRHRAAAIVIGSALLLAAALLAGLYGASQQAPAFYAQALAAPDVQRRAASDAMLENATALANCARREGRWAAAFTADEINGWLAVDAVENHPELFGKSIHDPRLMLSDEGAVVACRYEAGAISAVLSMCVDIYLDEPNVVALRFCQARAGALPIPLSQALDAMRQTAERLELRLDWRQADGDPVALVTLPPARDSDDTLFQLESLEIRDGTIYLAGRTERVGEAGPSSAEPPIHPLVEQAGLNSTNQR